jgi:hypothetical protein
MLLHSVCDVKIALASGGAPVVYGLGLFSITLHFSYLTARITALNTTFSIKNRFYRLDREKFFCSLL